MKLKYYQISIRYENKMHDFHGWGGEKGMQAFRKED